MEKKFFETPEVEVISLAHKDVIATSPIGGDPEPGPETPVTPPSTDKSASLTITGEDGSLSVGTGGIGTAF